MLLWNGTPLGLNAHVPIRMAQHLALASTVVPHQKKYSTTIPWMYPLKLLLALLRSDLYSRQGTKPLMLFIPYIYFKSWLQRTVAGRVLFPYEIYTMKENRVFHRISNPWFTEEIPPNQHSQMTNSNPWFTWNTSADLPYWWRGCNTLTSVDSASLCRRRA